MVGHNLNTSGIYLPKNVSIWNKRFLWAVYHSAWKNSYWSQERRLRERVVERKWLEM